MRANWAALWLAFLLSLSTPFAQAQGADDYSSAAPGRFSCGSEPGANASLPPVDDPYSGMSLMLLAEKPGDIPADAKLAKFGPFDEAKFGSSAVEFYQFLTGEATGSLATETRAHIYLRIVRSSGEAWYAVAANAPDTLLADPPPKNQEVTAEDEAANQRREPRDEAPVAISTPEPALPLFELSYDSRWMGANASGGDRHVLLVDLRAAPPRIARHMQCIWGEGGGACTAIDAGYASRTHLSCDWNHEVSDYRCTERENLSPGWGTRFIESEYLLLSGRDAFQLPEDSPGSLERYVSLQRFRSVSGQKVFVPDVGEATAIYSVAQQEQDVHLFAARGRGDSLDARFFLVESPNAVRPILSMELKPVTASALQPVGFGEAEHQRQQAAQPPAPHVSTRAGGEALSYDVRKIHGEDEFFVLQVTVKEGGNHVVYWIGVDQRPSAIVADLYRVVTDAVTYAGCNTFQQEEGAASYRLLPGRSFRALLEIEPAHTVVEGVAAWALADDLSSGEQGQVCTRRVSWDRSKGFVFGENPVNCKNRPARSISISDAGKLIPAPFAP